MPPEADPVAPRPRILDPVVVLSAAATFLLLVAVSEAASRRAARTGFWYERLDFAGTVTSLPELRERIRWAASRPRPVFLLGDSVLGASALIEHETPGARRSTLAARLKEREAALGRHVESLAADGMLVPDLEGEARLLEDARGARTILVLNVRMFSGEFQDPKKAASREFLEEGFGSASASAFGPSIERTLPDREFERSALLRSTAMLKSLWYFPTRRDFFRRAAERVLGRDGDPDLQEAALRLKVAPYYRERWNPSSLAFRSLDRVLRELAGKRPVTVVLTPQNPDFVEDPRLFAENRAVLGQFVRAMEIRGLEYLDWADRYPPDRFLDHCHLTADGNREYAGELARRIEE